MSTLVGLDCTNRCTADVAQQLKDNAYQFVGRYYSRTTKIDGKKLTRDEALTISKAGLQLVAVYEDGPTNYAYFSADRGTQDAKGAVDQAVAVRQPQGTAIYFTVDYDAKASEIAGEITNYFKAINQAIGSQFVVGVYGSGATCQAMLSAGLAKLAWLSCSTSWSGTKTFTGWAIKQGNPKTILGLNADPDQATENLGGFVVT
jgi:hypothetical protein